jgi:aspartate aminotransferase
MLADRLKTLVPSATLAMNAKARAMRAQGIDVISFSVGEPDFDTPKHIKDAAVRALDKGQTKYTEVGGIAELRAAVCHKLRRDHGLEYAPDEVTVSCGAKHTLYNIVMALVNPGDEVLIPSPYWVSYPEQVRLLGGVPVPVPTHESTGFDLDPAAVARAVTSRTKLIILDSPGNPTGAVFSPAALGAVAKLALEHGFWVVSDECYEALTYEGRHVSIASLSPEIKARTLLVNTCSKAYAMTGWRIGYAAGPKEIVRAMTDIQSQVTSNPASIAQWAAVEALTGPQDEIAKMVGEFDRRRRFIIEALNAVPGVRCTNAKGAFYAFPNVSGLFGKRWKGGVIRGSADLCAFLLEDARIACVAGVDFGSDDHIRISYATGLDTIREGMRRMETAVRGLANS